MELVNPVRLHMYLSQKTVDVVLTSYAFRNRNWLLLDIGGALLYTFIIVVVFLLFIRNPQSYTKTCSSSDIERWWFIRLMHFVNECS